VGVNDVGITLALINWYSVNAASSNQPVSRGEVVRLTLPGETCRAVETRLRELPLDRMRPFRLIGVFPGEETISEWLWDIQRLDRIRHSWRMGIWISSGHDERGAQAVRARIFQQALRQPAAGTLAWLRRLLRSHLPSAGPYSICMHRPDAVTVSCTEIQVSSREVHLRYVNGSPCKRTWTGQQSLPLNTTLPRSSEEVASTKQSSILAILPDQFTIH
jgi:hypothetical protein